MFSNMLQYFGKLSQILTTGLFLHGGIVSFPPLFM